MTDDITYQDAQEPSGDNLNSVNTKLDQLLSLVIDLQNTQSAQHQEVAQFRTEIDSIRKLVEDLYEMQAMIQRVKDGLRDLLSLEAAAKQVQLQEKIEKLSNQVNELEGQVDGFQGTIKTKDDEINLLKTQIRAEKYTDNRANDATYASLSEHKISLEVKTRLKTMSSNLKAALDSDECNDWLEEAFNIQIAKGAVPSDSAEIMSNLSISALTPPKKAMGEREQPHYSPHGN